MEQSGKTTHVTIAEIARRAGVSSATVSYVLSGRKDVKVAEQTRSRVMALCRELGYEKGAKRERTAEKKQVTIDDIAREAGVSTATVSYIINDRKDVKISDETRRKVLQICNLRQYTPSPVARLLAGKKNNLIGICAPQSPYPVCNAAYYATVQALQACLQEKGYGTLLLSPADRQEMRLQENLDGIVCIDLTEEEFYALKESCFVPIVAVDMIVEDPLFFKTYTDHAAVIDAAKQLLQADSLIYLACPCRNAPYLDDLRRALREDILFLAEDPVQLYHFVAGHADRAMLFGDELLAAMCLPILDKTKTAVLCGGGGIPNVGRIVLPTAEKAQRAVGLLQDAIGREETKPHTCLLRPITSE